jgi:hypothetical protein
VRRGAIGATLPEMRTALILSLLLTPLATSAAELEGDDSNYRDLLEQLRPGDTLRLAAGEYTRGLPLSNLHGTEAAPIVITGPTGRNKAVILGRSCCNTISLTDVSWVVIKNFELDARGELVDGVKVESNGTVSHHVTLENLELHGFGADQQVVGISTKATAIDFVIRGNTIRDAGTGLYLGNSDGSAPFIRGIVENNLVVNPIGYGMEIKHQIGRPNLPEIPDGDSVTLVRHNVFMKYAGASAGDLARPNLLVGAWPESGAGSNDRYEIYGNFLYENETGTEPLFQGEGHVSFHDNVLVNSFGDGAWLTDINGAPKEVHVYNNTIYVAGLGVLVTRVDPAFRQLVVGNAIFAGEGIRGGDATDNTRGSVLDAAASVFAPSYSLGIMSFYPLPGALEGSSLDRSAFAADIGAGVDFNGDPKSPTRRGAYAGEGTNPGWPLDEAIKGFVAVERPDAGSSDGPRPMPMGNDLDDDGDGDGEAGCSCAAVHSRRGSEGCLVLMLLFAFRRRASPAPA